MAKEALERITLLYEVEADGKTLRNEGRQQLHKEKNLPVLKDLQARIQDRIDELLPFAAVHRLTQPMIY
jgi:hypothetical protein